MENNKKIIIGVLGLPIRKNGQGWEFFLTQRFSPKRPEYHQKWQLAGGGLEFGETPEETLVREFKEELDIVPQILYPHPIVFTNTWQSHIDDASTGAHIVLMGFIVSIGTQEPHNIDPDHETGDMRWFTHMEVKNLCKLPKTLEYIEAALKIIDKENFSL